MSAAQYDHDDGALPCAQKKLATPVAAMPAIVPQMWPLRPNDCHLMRALFHALRRIGLPWRSTSVLSWPLVICW